MEVTITTNDLINFSQAAKLLNVSRPTIYKLIRNGNLRPVVFSDRRFLVKAEVEQYSELKANGS